MSIAFEKVDASEGHRGPSNPKWVQFPHPFLGSGNNWRNICLAGLGHEQFLWPVSVAMSLFMCLMQ